MVREIKTKTKGTKYALLRTKESEFGGDQK
jgi:hypothetical protein